MSEPAATLESSVCFALYTSMQTTLQLYRELLEPWGLTYQQLMVLAVVWERGEVSPGELAETLCLDASSVSGLVGRLERLGYLEREHRTSDRRSVRVTATERALAVRGELGHIERCVAEAMQMTPADAESVVATLRSLRRSMLGYDARAATAAGRTHPHARDDGRAVTAPRPTRPQARGKARTAAAASVSDSPRKDNA